MSTGGSGGSLSSSQEPIEPNVANCTGLSSVIWQQKSHNQKGGICKKKKRNRLSPFLNTGPILEKFLKQTKHTVSLASCHLPHAPLRQTVMPPPVRSNLGKIRSPFRGSHKHSSLFLKTFITSVTFIQHLLSLLD